ncbi:MAG: hypothetical protein A2445_01065 [Candidatus Jacksonbacteria bacterium RIFOXYC2_FULL_44_29]|nr:MAG: Methyltransferase type 11 [Parcubacteria group bacterium GW2011_GWC2_44_22]OGY77160.1 MAG: hypothetical protein A2295_04790 [Candidatus Jacksonbacteria bacterium RIFOXYB2_FULL_44_15]OGY78251.1 MAG: hypothetical protein A2550_01400 [Candidatus Jacksonbacteria bacterium RIFOXYD2_FULL_43_21]OGY79952.1 MAG: hypothetical protein A2445_01065 [Candidatus Jacksonbacteria bacterium RIFOXYC2_FULL_44_29]HBH46969.1 hypothetical protein [Candidatus Jacksonbacteria bacterium]
MTCPICSSSTNIISYLPRPDYHEGHDLVFCQICGTYFASPPPSTQELNQFYQSYDVLGVDEPYYRELNRPDYFKTRSGREVIEKALWLQDRHQIPVGARVLDVGSGHGVWLEVCRRLDWQGQGIELSSAAAKASQERFSIQVFAGRIDDFSAQSQNYDLITLWDIIEHVTNPRQLLAKCAQLVKKNGLLVIETPNSRALINKVAYFLYRLGWREPARTLHGLHHVVLFHQATMSKLLGEAGFNVVKIYSTRTSVGRVFKKQNLLAQFQKLGLDLVFVLGRIIRQENKMIIVARKM